MSGFKITANGAPSSFGFSTTSFAFTPAQALANNPYAPPTPKPQPTQFTRFFKYIGVPEVVDLTPYESIVISAVGAGGSGGAKSVVLSTRYSGAGGGAGGSINGLPIFVQENNYKQLSILVGRGGRNVGEKGEDSIFILDSVIYKLFGGKGGVTSNGGEGGFGNVVGTNGFAGSASFPSAGPAAGARGGQAFIGFGGGSPSIESKALFPPIETYGGGGKGMDTDSDQFGVGGDGIVIITFNPKKVSN